MADFFAAAHYEMDNYVPSETYLEDEEYGRALDTLVKGDLQPSFKGPDTSASSAVNSKKVQRALVLYAFAATTDVILTDGELGKV